MFLALPFLVLNSLVTTDMTQTVGQSNCSVAYILGVNLTTYFR